jgi:hypothetical protein
MTALSITTPPRLYEYDSVRKRLWILGQRCHHGATGSLVTALACVGLIVPASRGSAPAAAAPLVALVATGGALMAHDWKDRPIWFERGYGTQP